MLGSNAILEYCNATGTNDTCKCIAAECLKLWNTSVEEAEACYTTPCFLSKQALDPGPLHQVTVAYIVILIVGVIGNVGTCIVIRRHPLLRTHSSYYLLNLAISDLVTLCIGMPFEIITNWNQYPWPFPDFFCNFKALLAETTNSVSGLTILIFSVERYLAICHPFLFVKLKPVRKNVSLLLLSIWLISMTCALPYVTHHTTDFFLKAWPYTSDGPPVLSSKMCMLAIYYMTGPETENEYFELKVLFHFSAVSFFAIPLLCILVMYVAIAHKIKGRRKTVVYHRSENSHEPHFRVTFILMALVISFFICYTPFQFQRLAFFYIDPIYLQEVNQYMYFISGFLYYLATIINPILYNLVSSRFRKASKEVFMSLLPCVDRSYENDYPPFKYAMTTSARYSESQKLKCPAQL